MKNTLEPIDWPAGPCPLVALFARREIGDIVAYAP